MKFLRLMGGQKFVEAAKALAPCSHVLLHAGRGLSFDLGMTKEAGVDDDQVFELIAGEWVEAKEDVEEEEEDKAEFMTPFALAVAACAACPLQHRRYGHCLCRSLKSMPMLPQ